MKLWKQLYVENLMTEGFQSSICMKELGRHHSILINKKLKKLKNYQLFLRSIEVRSGANYLLPNWRHHSRQTLRITAWRSETHKHQSPQESVLSGETRAVIDKLLEAQCGQVWEIKNKKNPGEPVTTEPPFFFTSGPQVNIGGEIPSCFSREGGKWTILKYARAIYFLSSSLRRN